MPDNLEEQLSAYLDGELSETERAEVERVLAADPQARALLDSLRCTVELVQGLPRRAAPELLFDDLSGRIEREQLLGGHGGLHASVPTRRTVWPMLASAAVVLFAVGAGFWAFRELTPSKRDFSAVATARKSEEKERSLTPPPPPLASQEPRTESTERFLGDRLANAQAPDKSRAKLAPAEAGKKLDDKFTESAPPAPAGPNVTAEKARDNESRPAESDLGLDAVVSAKPQTQPQAAGEIVVADGGALATNDAVRINVSFQNESDLAECRERLARFLDANQIAPQPLDPVAGTEDLRFGRQAGLASDLKGLGSNTAGPMLVEVPANKVDALVDQLASSASDRRGIELEIGQYVVASGPRQVLDVLNSRRDKDEGWDQFRKKTKEDLPAAAPSLDTRANDGALAAVTAPAQESPEVRSSAASTDTADSLGALAKQQKPARGGPAAEIVVRGHEGGAERAALEEASKEAVSATRPVEPLPAEPDANTAKDVGSRGNARTAGEEVVRLVINFLTPRILGQSEASSQPSASQPATSQPTQAP